MTELCCLFNQRRALLQLPTLCHLPLSVIFHHLLLPFFFCCLFFLSFTFISTSLSILFFPLFLSPSSTSTFWPVSLPPSLSPRPSLLSLSCFHSHTLSLFPSIGFNCAKFVRSHWRRPLGDKEMTEGGLYLPLRPLPCRLLNHVANRQHCLPARPHSDNGEPHSYLIQWSV